MRVRWWICVCLAWACVWSGREALHAQELVPTGEVQEQSADDASADDELLEGLLGLLDGPSKDAGAEPSTSRSAVVEELRTIQREMKQAATKLRARRTVASVEMQQDQIVSQLDQLIATLREQAASSGKNDTSGGDESEPATQDQVAEQASRRPNAEDQSGTTAGSEKELQDGDGDANESRPGADSSGEPPSEGVAGGEQPMKDDRGLQQGAWGNLPPQLRQRIQSRMVEQFLPAYRDKIQAYYRAMMKQRGE